MKTVLELYCEFAGWKGGTIHGALLDFKNRPLDEMDRFCGTVVDGSVGISDLANVRPFMLVRMERAGLVVAGVGT
jgi:hypothetical protein